MKSPIIFLVLFFPTVLLPAKRICSRESIYRLYQSTNNLVRGQVASIKSQLSRDGENAQATRKALWELLDHEGAVLKNFQVPTDEKDIKKVMFVPDSSEFLVQSKERIELWNTKNLALRFSLKNFECSVSDCIVSTSGSDLFYVSGKELFYQSLLGEKLLTFSIHWNISSEARSLAISEKYFVFQKFRIGTGFYFCCLDLKTNKIKELACPPGIALAQSVVFSSCGTYLIASLWRNQIVYWDLSQEAPACTWLCTEKNQLSLPEQRLNKSNAPVLAASSQGCVAAGCSDGSMFVWRNFFASNQARGFQLTFDKDYFDPITALAFFPTGNLLVAGSAFGVLRFWSLGKQKCLKTLDGFSKISSIDFSSDGQLLVVGHEQGVSVVHPELASGYTCKIQ